MREPLKFGYRATTQKRALMMALANAGGYCVFWPLTLLRRLTARPLATGTSIKIAVFRLDGIGDLILSAPSLAFLRELFPDAHITLFVNAWSKGIAELIDGPDETIALDAPFFTAFKESSKFSAIRKEKRFLNRHARDHRYDLVIDLRGDLLSILPASWLRSSTLAARRTRAGGFLLSHVVDQSNEGKISEVDLNVDFIAKLFSVSPKPFPLQLQAVPTEQLSSVFTEALSGFDSGYMTLAVAAPYERRMYPIEKWRSVIQHLRSLTSIPIVILGTAKEKDRCDSVAQNFEHVTVCAGTFSLEESAECIRRSVLFAGNDGGLSHIAAAYEVPLVQLFGPGSSVAFGHRGDRQIVLQDSCEFNACAEVNCERPERWCMDHIDPAVVAGKIMSLMSMEN